MWYNIMDERDTDVNSNAFTSTASQHTNEPVSRRRRHSYAARATVPRTQNELVQHAVSSSPNNALNDAYEHHSVGTNMQKINDY